MNLQDFLSQGLSLVGTFNLKIALFLFLTSFIGEAVGVFVPYLFEATWLMVGYQFSSHVLSFPDLILLVLMAQAGRQGGALVLYGISLSGSNLLVKYKNHFKIKTAPSEVFPFKKFRKINFLSPFSVTLGRLLWLRIPLTLILGAKRKLKVLMIGVLFSSLIYDAIYIIMGAVVGTTTKLAPVYVLLYSLAALTIVYGIFFVTRRIMGNLANRRKAESSSLS